MNFDLQKPNLQPNIEQPDIQTHTVGGVLYFTIDRGSDDKQYWKTDGTTKGTTCLNIS